MSKEPLAERALTALFDKVNDDKDKQWWHLPNVPAQLANLVALRVDLREKNLHDTPLLARTAEKAKEISKVAPPRALRTRTPGGYYNDLDDPLMGSVGTRFGRNLPPEAVNPEPEPGKADPNPREVALRLMKRDTFKPATTLNLLAAAWIQFQNHNWFFHGKGDPDDVLEVPLPDGDDWPENPMRIRRTVPVAASKEGSTTTPNYGNTENHWWDGSQIYGATKEIQDSLRTFEDGKLKIGADGRLLPHATVEGVEHTGFSENWWMGLSLLHTLFTKEHNHICDVLKKHYPNWDDQQLFDTAWLVNSALMAKIHTVEWTPGILAHPALKIGMEANWWGLAGKRVKDRFGRISDEEAVSGIIGSPKDHHGVPFQLTEEFVSVYRLHPLIPDDYTFLSLDGSDVVHAEFDEIQGKHTRDYMGRFDAADLLYSFGVMNPGAVRLKNYPRALMRHERIENGELVDLATLDIVRDRERGIPRYNDFREQLRMPRIRSFEDLTDDRALAQELREVYDDDIDKVDLQVGMYAEPLPPGFGFSDTAFRIFILMASRRLKSDRFFTDAYTPEVYSPEGLDYVENTTMKDVLLRHHPELAPALDGVDQVFAPWNRLPSSRERR